MSAHNFDDLSAHVGHKIVVVQYGKDEPVNVAIECLHCSEVLLTFEKYPDPYYGDDPCFDAVPF